jgi:type II restriction enzyme
MNLSCNTELSTRYVSGSQIARVLTEDWCTRELYCPACSHDRLRCARPNTQAIDFDCSQCEQSFQLKSGRNWNARKIVDAGYEAMMRAIRADKTPNLLVLQYSDQWAIRNLLLVPRVFLSESVIERRKPLAEGARRAGWVGCNILVSEVPIDGRIEIIKDGAEAPKDQVRRRFQAVKNLANVRPRLRGWTIDVLRIIRKLNCKEFTLDQVYSAESSLQDLHPINNNVRPKIRQQLQVLRDLGFIKFVSPGHYSMVK